jgi:hypothetical protein
LASKYDVKVVVPLLMVCFDWLNLFVGTFAIAAIYAIGPKLEETCLGLGLQFKNLLEH